MLVTFIFTIKTLGGNRGKFINDINFPINLQFSTEKYGGI